MNLNLNLSKNVKISHRRFGKHTHIKTETVIVLSHCRLIFHFSLLEQLKYFLEKFRILISCNKRATMFQTSYLNVFFIKRHQVEAFMPDIWL